MARNLVIQQSLDEVISTITALPRVDESSPIEFRIPQSHGFLLHPMMQLHLQVSLTKSDGGKLTAEDKAALIPFPLMTMWKSVEVEICQQRVTPNNMAHPYVSFISAYREFTRDEREVYLKRSLWAPDSNNAHNRFDNPPTVGFINRGLSERLAAVINNPFMDLYGPLMVDILRQPQPFPDEIDMTIKLYRTSNKFCIMADSDPDAKYELTIHRADLCVTRLRYSNTGAESSIFKLVKSQLVYPYIGSDTRHFIIPSKVTSVSLDIYDGVIPDKVVFVQLNSDSYNGAYRLNPLQMLPYGMKSAVLQVNNNAYIPNKPYEVNIEDDVLSRVYMESMKIIGSDMAYIDYKGGTYLVAFDLQKDRSSTIEERVKKRENIQLRLLIDYEKELVSPIVILCIFQFPKVLCIKSNLQVTHL